MSLLFKELHNLKTKFKSIFPLVINTVFSFYLQIYGGNTTVHFQQISLCNRF